MSDSVIEIELNNGTKWTPTASQIEVWVRSFPSLDVTRELVEIQAYCMNNPTKRWTPRGVNKAVHENLRNKNDRAVSRAANIVNFSKPAANEKKHPAQSATGDLLRHLFAGDRIMRYLLNDPALDPREDEGTYRINLTKLARAIIDDARSERAGGREEPWTTEAQLRSACFGTMWSQIEKHWAKFA